LSETSGVCTIVPRGQDGFRPTVFGMGILVDDREIVTCAHVINAALGSDWRKASGPAVVKVCFPLADGSCCVEGTADRKRWFPPGRTKGGELSDVAVIQLAQDAPPSVGRAVLRRHAVGKKARAYGFRGHELDNGSWLSHPDGEWAEGNIVGPLPGGRAQFDGLRPTGAPVQKGFSGGGVYDPNQHAVVGMIVEADREKDSKIAQFVDALSLMKALGRPETELPEPEETGSLVRAHSGFIDFTRERLRHGTIFKRDAVFHTVRGWFDGFSKGWILIRGGPGTGKSAILSALLDRLEAELGRGAVPHHFLRRGQANWDEPDAVLRNLNAQLEGLAKPVDQVNAQGLEQFEVLLARAVEHNPSGPGRLVVVIDGLDEAAAPVGEDGVLQRFLPAYLPEGVWIVCSSRPNFPELGWLEQRLGLRTIDLDQGPWLDDNRRVVEAYWRNKGPQLEPPIDDPLQEAAIKAAQGNILHAVTLHDAFEVNPQFRDPRRIPIGFEALLEQMWLRLAEMDDRETSKHAIDGLGLLAIAGEALPLSTVASLLDWDHPADISNFKRYALPFLLEENADWHGGEARYRPFHEATREFLTTGDHMWPEVRRKNHSLLASRLAVWPPDDDADAFKREYAARYALRHLLATVDRGRIADLLSDLRYGVAALKALGPHLLLDQVRQLLSHDKPPELAERAKILGQVLRLESQWLETHPQELPSLIHNWLLCRGRSRDQIRASFSGFDSGWGLIKAVEIGDEICILRGHSSSVKTCDLDARGRYGASGGLDGTVRLWDLERGTTLHVLKPDPKAVRCDVDSCALSLDGRYLVTASQLIRWEPRRDYWRVQVWNTRDGQLILDLDFDYDTTKQLEVAFSGNERAIACHASGRIDIHNIGNNTTSYFAIGEPITGDIDVDRSGLLLAAVVTQGCSVWDLRTREKLFNVKLAGAKTCSFSPDSRSLAVANQRCAIVASTSDGSTLHQTDAIRWLEECRLLPNGRLLFTSGSGCELIVWNMDNDHAVERYQGHTYSVDCCASTPDGRYALTGGGDNIVRLWSLSEKVITPQIDRHEHLVYGCAVDQRGTFACSAPQSAAPVLWNACTGSRDRSIDCRVSYGNVRFCQLGNGDPRLVTLGNSLQIWDPSTGRLEREWKISVDRTIGGVRFVSDIAFAKSDLRPLLQTDSHLLVWRDVETLQAIDIPNKAAVSRLHGGRSIAVLDGDGKIEIVNLDDPRSRTTIADGVRSCVGSPRSFAVYALMLNKQLCRLDASSGKVQLTLGEITQEHVRLLIDGQEQALWALCHDGGFALQMPTNEVLMAFSLDGSGGLQVAKVPGHDVYGFGFFPDGRLVTAGWADATIRVWGSGQSMEIAAVSGSAPFRCVDVADDRIVAGDQKGNVWFLAPVGQL
jgi:WD40 repeat protein